MAVQEWLEPTYHTCAWLTVQRCLVETHIQQAARIRDGEYQPLPYAAPLTQLALFIQSAICRKTRFSEESAIPPLLPLTAQLPLHMQAQLEQAIAAERQGDASHRQQVVSPQWVGEQLAQFAERARPRQTRLEHPGV